MRVRWFVLLGRAAAATLAVAAVLLVIPPVVQPKSTETAGDVERAMPASREVVTQVVVVSVDGLNPRAIRRLGRRKTPALHRMMAQGATTLNARTERESTRTLPNHTGMMTGRRVGLPGGHGVDFNFDNGRTVRSAAGEKVSSVFTVVHNHAGSTRLYAAKKKFAFLNRSWNMTNGTPDRVGRDGGRDKIDRYFLDNEHDLVRRLRSRLLRDPDELSFLYLGLPDRAGHRFGFMSQRYLRAVQRTDALVDRLLSTIAGKARLSRHTTVILTADHGGRGPLHIDPTRRVNYTVPLMVWGATVVHGRSLYALNPDRKRPGDRRTTYSGKQPIRNAEVGNLVTDLLGLPRIPGSQANRRQTLDVS